MLIGQPFLDLLQWHPRDVDTAWQELADRQAAIENANRESRFAAMEAETRQQMAGRR